MNHPWHPAALELKRLLADGIRSDIYLALESHGVFKTIGERVQAADASSYQPMLIALQAYSVAIFILAVTALHERQGPKYELHSVHGVLTHLRNNAQHIPVRQPIFAGDDLSGRPSSAYAQAVTMAYREAFPVGTRVRILDRTALERFHQTWKYHHPLEPSMLEFAAVVDRVGFYHGGDVLYVLREITGVWHEVCLVPDSDS